MRLTSATPPCALPALPSFPAASTTTQTINWGSTGSIDTSFHGSVLVHSGSTLLIKPGSYRIGALTLEWGATLRVDTTGLSQTTTPPRLDIVATDSVQFMDGAITTYPGLSDSLAASRIGLYLPGAQKAIIGNGVALRLSLLDPQGWIALGERIQLWGRVLGHRVQWGNGSKGVFAGASAWPNWYVVDGTVSIGGARRFWTNLHTLPVSWTVGGVTQTTGTTETFAIEGSHWIKRTSGSLSDSVLALVDWTAPVVAISSPADQSQTNKARVAVLWSIDGVPQSDSASLQVGSNSITRTSTDSAGNVGTATVTVTRDTTAPVVVILSPANGTWTNNSSVTVRWSVDGVAQTPSSQILTEGLNTIRRSSTDAAGNTGSASVQVHLDTQAPAVAIISPTNGDTVRTSSVAVTWSVDGVSRTDNAALVEGTNTITRSSTDSAGNTGSASIQVIYAQGSTSGGDALVAPALPSTGIPTLTQRLSFLYTGDSAIQVGAVADSLVAKRLSQVFGTVRGLDSSLLSDVRVEILSHPEYGHTFTRSNGRWDLAINGGGSVVVSLSKSGYLPVQRQISLLWNQIVHVEEVFLTPISSTSLVANVAGTSPIAQAVVGERVSDSSGARQAVLNLPSGLSARVVDSAGDTTLVSSLTLRATEYTVGTTGAKAMPGTLPATSAYTYAVELSADEALSSNAKSIVFNKTASFFVENFLSFPVGTTVPTGWYDRAQGQWIASDNGHVIKILSVADGSATLDINGDGLADVGDSTPSTEDRALLANRYTAGQTLWWVPMKHLTAWDCNWGWGPPDDATYNLEIQDVDAQDDCATCNEGSVIRVEDRSLGEVLPVLGADWSLNWSSQRAKGRTISRTTQLHLSGSSIPPDLESIVLYVDVAGQHYEQTYAPQPNLDVNWTWDGKDGWGRDVSGLVNASIQIGYLYRGVYKTASKFGYNGGGSITGSRTRTEVTLWQKTSALLSNGMGADWGFGGWTPTQLHRLDPAQMEVHLGSGGLQKGQDVSQVLETVVASIDGWAPGLAFAPDGSFWIASYSGRGVYHYSASGVLLKTFAIGSSHGVLIQPDGTILVSTINANPLYRINLDGSISTLLAGSGYCGDGGAASSACASSIWSIARGLDGSIYMADGPNYRIRRIDPDGTISTFAGTGRNGYSGDEGSATSAQIGRVEGVGIRKNGDLIFSDPYNNRVREVDASGIVHTIAGTGTSGHSGDGGLATNAMIAYPTTVAESPDGDVCFTEESGNSVRCVDSRGYIRTVAGTGVQGMGATPGFATGTAIYYPQGLAFDPQGHLNFIDRYNYRLLRLRDKLASDSGVAQYVIPSQDGSEVWDFDIHGKHLSTRDGVSGDTLWVFEYGADSLLSAIRDRQGQRFLINRSSNSITLTAPASRGSLRTVLTLDNSGRVSGVRVPDGRTWAMTWKDGDLLTSFAKPDGGTSRITYDADGQLVRDTDPRGGWQELSGGRSKGVVTVQHKTSGGAITTYKTTTLTTGEVDRVHTAADGSITKTYQYTDGSQKQVDPDGTVTQTTTQADPRWSLAAPILATRTETTPAGVVNSESWSSTVSGSSLFGFATLTNSYTRNGKTSTTVWNRNANQITTALPSGLVTTQTLDSRHRVVQEAAPGRTPVSYAYDALDRLTSATQGGRTTRYTWDDSGRVSGLTDPLGRSQSFRYDIAGRTLAQIFPDGRKVAFGYDAGDRVTSVTPPGRSAHGFAYDKGGLDTLAWAPKLDLNDSTPTKSKYDLDKHPTLVVLPSGDSLREAYDAAGRLKSVASSRDTIGYAYDAAGRLDTLRRGVQSLALTYDGSLPLTQSWSGAITGTVATTWNANFRPASQTAAGSAISYTYDADGVLSQAGSLTVSRNTTSGLYAKDALGTLTHALGRNLHGEVITDTVSNGSAILSLVALTRDSLGRIVSKSDSVNGTRTNWRYHYDVSGRLDSVWLNGSVSAWYGYDSNGVRLSGTGITGVSVDAQDRVISSNGITYAYDDNGQLVSRSTLTGTTRYHYTPQGELLSVVIASGDSISYTLDPAGRRIARSLNGVVTNRWLWDGSLRPVAEVDSAGNLLTRYVYATHTNVPDYLVRSGVTYRLVTDERGSVRLVVNASTGAVVSALSYDAWGNVTSSTNASFQPFGFAGGLRDDATGLTHFGAREYLPELSRWTRKDPIGFNGGLTNLYGYVGNDPVNWADANGQFGVPGAIIGAAAGMIGGSITGGLEGALYGGLVGAVTGAIIPGSEIVGVQVLVNAGVGALNSYLGQGIGNKVKGKNWNCNISYGAIAGAAIGGASFGTLGGVMNLGGFWGGAAEASISGMGGGAGEAIGDALDGPRRGTY